MDDTRSCQDFRTQSYYLEGFGQSEVSTGNALDAEGPRRGKEEIPEPTRRLMHLCVKFGKVMSAHFEQLGEEQEKAKISEQVGPLAADALKREEERRKKESKTQHPGIQPYDKKKAEQKAKEDAKVRDIVNDPELAALLMDQNMQRILQECGDPEKFQRHMRNPQTQRGRLICFSSQDLSRRSE